MGRLFNPVPREPADHVESPPDLAPFSKAGTTPSPEHGRSGARGQDQGTPTKRGVPAGKQDVVIASTSTPAGNIGATKGTPMLLPSSPQVDTSGVDLGEESDEDLLFD